MVTVDRFHWGRTYFDNYLCCVVFFYLTFFVCVVLVIYADSNVVIIVVNVVNSCLFLYRIL